MSRTAEIFAQVQYILCKKSPTEGIFARFGTLVKASVDLLFLRLFKRFLKLGLGVGLGLGLGIVLGLRLGTRLALGLRVGWVLCVTTRSYSN